MKEQKPLSVFSTALFLAAWLGGCSEPAPKSSWISGGTLLDARSGHSATRLDDGSVLFVGGEHATGQLATSELRDTVTNQWSTTGPLKDARSQHAAVKRSDGQIMVIGGKNAAGLSSCIEVFQPAKGKFVGDDSFAGDCPENPTMTSVDWSTRRGVGADETSQAHERVIVTNGTTSEVRWYDSESRSWSGQDQSALLAQRSEYTTTALTRRRRNSILDVPAGAMSSDLVSEDGAIFLAVGGVKDGSMQPIAEYLDVVACAKNAMQCTWKNTETAGTNRRHHTATWIGNGEVLVVGGKDDADQILTTAERYRYDWDYDTWTLTSAKSMDVARYGHTATRLNSGNVLIVGGRDASDQPMDSVELYDVAGDAFFELPAMSSPRAEHTATWLSDGTVLVAGGVNAATTRLGTTERFVPENVRIPCERTAECPRAMICNAEKACEQAVGPLGSEPACAYSGERGSANAGSVAGWFVLLLGAWGMRRKRSSRRGAVAFVGGAILLVPSLSHAQTPTFYLDRLQIAGGSEDGTGVWRPVFGRTGLFGQVALGYARDPLPVASFVHDATRARALDGPAVRLQITGYATAGIEFAKRGSIQVSVPYVIEQRGSATNDRTVGLTQVVSMAPSALGDVRIDGRMLLLWNESRSFLVGARVAAFLPTGDEFSFTGEGALWGHAGLSAEYNTEAVFFTTNAGLTMRPKSSLVDLTVGSEFVYTVGAFVPLKHDRIRLGAELWGSVGLSSHTPEAIPVEAALSGRMTLGASKRVFLGLSAGGRLGVGYAPDIRIVARIGGVLPFEEDKPEPTLPVRVVAEADTDGDGFLDGDDKCPTVKEDFLREKDGCPETDEDNDGIVTSIDACPKVPEDKDDLADEDGCPEDDFDGDGFADVDDKCPKEPGVRNEDPAKLGCPEFIQRTKTEVKLVKQIEFEFNSATITAASYPILDEIAKLLVANADIKQLRIEGHTDDVGDAAFNQSLSLRRAEAVQNYLVQRGKVKPSRLTFQGFGRAKPIAPNDTEAGRAKNRRVELHIGDATGGEESGR